MHEYVPSRNFLTFLAPHTYFRNDRIARGPGVKTRGVREAGAWFRSAGRPVMGNDPEDSARIIGKALDAGINLIDTAVMMWLPG
jgi:hypothetical protein